MIAPPFFLAAGLLVWGGLAKLRRPQGTAGALSDAGLGLLASSPLVRGLGVLELGVGLVCLLAPRPVFALALAALYLAFGGFLTLVIVRGAPVSSCGCLGDREVSPSFLHLAFNVLAAAAGVVAAVVRPAGVFTVAGEQPLFGIPFLLGLAIAAYLVYLVESFLSGLFFSYRRSTPA